MQNLLQIRLEEAENVKKIIDRVYQELEKSTNEEEELDTEDGTVAQVENDEWFDNGEKESIKAFSPFTNEFLKIESYEKQIGIQRAEQKYSKI